MAITLTAAQEKPANHRSGHSRVIAPPGSGKTATLTHFVKNRLSAGIDPRRLLVLMFNKAAQVEFSDRLEQVCFDVGLKNLPEVRTFHSLGLKIYKSLVKDGQLAETDYRPVMGLRLEIKIKQLISEKASAKIQQDIRDNPQPLIEVALSFIDFVKCGLDEPVNVFNDLKMKPELNFLVEVFQDFEQWRKSEGVITFSDMLYDPCRLFLTRPDVAKKFSNAMEEIVVDEYQDVNAIQQFLLSVVAGERGRLQVIGDPDQAIYGFRGSSPDFLLEGFTDAYPDVTTYMLPDTFRYGHAVSLAASHLISNNRQREPLLCVSSKGTPATVIEMAAVDDYAAETLGTIKRELLLGVAPYEIAVLTRLWGISRPIEFSLLKDNIPYQLMGGQPVLNRRELIPIFTLLEILCGSVYQVDEGARNDALFYLLSIPSPKIPHIKLREIAADWSNSEKIDSNSLKKAARKHCEDYQLKNLEKLAEVLRVSLSNDLSAAEAVSLFVRKSEMASRLKEDALTKQAGLEQEACIKAMLGFCKQHHNLSSKAMYHLLLTMQKSTSATRPSSDCIVITTMHRSKGLEWPVVILPGLSEAHIPYFSEKEMSVSQFDMESERRLMYVAMTRAKHKLLMSRPKGSPNSTSDEKENVPSVFIEEMMLEQSCELAGFLYKNNIPSEISMSSGITSTVSDYVRRLDLTINLLGKKVDYRPTTTSSNLVEGAHVSHKFFGGGIISSIEKNRISIDFGKKDGERTFVLDIAKDQLSVTR